MKVCVDRLTDAPTNLCFEADTAWWRTHMHPGPELPAELQQPLEIGLRVHTMGIAR